MTLVFMRVLDYFDSVFDLRGESLAGRWLDRAICFCVLLIALTAPVSIAAVNVAWIAGLFLWICRFFVEPRPRFFRTKVDWAILCFSGWTLVSCVFSYAPDLSFDRWRVTLLFPILYLVSQNLRGAKAVGFVTAALIFSMMFTVLWSFAERIPGRGVEVLGVKPDGLLAGVDIRSGDTLLKVNDRKLVDAEEVVDSLKFNEKTTLRFYRPDYETEATITERITPSSSIQAKDALGFESWQRSRNWRAAGFYSHYTSYAEVLQLVLSLTFGLFVASVTTDNKKIAWRRMWTNRICRTLLICVIGMSAALLMTATRASQAGFLLSALAIVAVGANRRVFLGLLMLALPLAIVAAVYVQQTRNAGFVDSSDGSTTWRLTVWREGFDLLTKSPRHLIVGVGIDSVKRFKCEWGLFAGCTLPPGHFHSTPLQIAVETGLPALGFWLWFLFIYGKTLLGEKDEKGKGEKDLESSSVSPFPFSSFSLGLRLGAFGGLVGFFAGGLVHYNLGDSKVAIVFYLIAGLALAARTPLKS